MQHTGRQRHPQPLDYVIERIVNEWYTTDDPRPLLEVLGMTAEQYGRWTADLMTGQELQDWADKNGFDAGEDIG